jgi:peroxiredoxin
MKVGTEVSDNRIMRRIGYWTGSGLSENLPAKGAQPQSAPNLDELMAILDNEPASELGLQTAAWILLNTPDGPEVERAGDVVIREHVQSPNLAYLCKEMERVRHRCAKKLLRALLDKNPNIEVRVTACFTLATLLKDEADFGKNKKATAEADALFQRVVTDFSGSGKAGAEYARRAKGELSELRRLTIGKTAPDFAGQGFDGEKIKLKDYRGKVVVLIFWTASTAEVGEENRKLVERMADKPVAFLGVNCDKDLDRAKSTAEKRHITWPTIWDGRSGPIFTDWNIDSWPNIFVIDRKGVIRFRHVRDRKLDEAVEELLRGDH